MKTCGDCQHWSANVEGGDAAELADVARCLRFPPVSVTAHGLGDAYPRTHRATWACGEFSQRPPRTVEEMRERKVVQSSLYGEAPPVEKLKATLVQRYAREKQEALRLLRLLWSRTGPTCFCEPPPSDRAVYAKEGASEGCPECKLDLDVMKALGEAD